MRYIKWAIIILFWGTVASVLNYTLPQHDVVRISDTYEKRIDPGENSIFLVGTGCWQRSHDAKPGRLFHSDP